MSDILVTLVFTAIGVLMKRFGYNRASFLLGFILGIHFEEFFWIALQSRGAFFFLRPGCLIIISIMILLYSLDPVRVALADAGKRGAGMKGGVLIPIVLIVVMVIATGIASGIPICRQR